MNKVILSAEKIIDQLQLSAKCFEVWKELNLQDHTKLQEESDLEAM